MKTCVVTATYSTNAAKVWLYMCNPNLNHWRTDLAQAEISADEMTVKEKSKDGSVTEIVFTIKEKPRKMSCNFAKGRVKGSFTAILLGGSDSTSVECTMEVEGMGLFSKPQKQLNERLEMLRKALGE